MIGVIVAFPNLEEAKAIKSLLMRNGIQVIAACTSGSQAITFFGDLDEALVICGYKLPDMLHTELLENMPDEFEMLVVASQNHYGDCDRSRVVCLPMPIKVQELIDTTNILLHGLYQKRKKRRSRPKTYSAEERAVIESAKERLMDQKRISEEEAHRYLQKSSMDSGVNMVEMAQMVLEIF